MQPEGYRSVDLLLEQKILICLKTLGSESFQNCSKDFIDLAQPTVSRVLSDFIETMIKLAPEILFLCQETITKFVTRKGTFIKLKAFLG